MPMWLNVCALSLLFVFALGCAAQTRETGEVVNPLVRSDGSVDCSTVDRILRDLVTKDMTDEEKVLAVFNWVRRTIYHGDGRERKHAYNLMYMVHVLGHGSCGRQTTPMALLLDRLGYRSENWTRHGHHLIQVFYGGKGHCLDPHMTFYVYDRAKPPTLASVKQLQADPSLALDAVKEGRACPGFLLCGDSPKTFAGTGGWRNHGAFPNGFPRPIVNEPFGRITLRRGESYARTWLPGTHWFRKNCWMKDSGPFHTCARRDRKDAANWCLYEPHAARVKHGLAYRHWGAGRLVYEPDLSGDHYADAVVSQTNLRPSGQAGAGALEPVDNTRPSEIVFSVGCPYVVTAGELTVSPTGPGAVAAAVTTDQGKTWRPIELRPVGTTRTAAFVDEVNGSFDGYWLRLRAEKGAGLSRLKLVTEFQLNPYSLPHLVPGRNRVTVGAERYGAPLTVTYRWSEGDGWKRPRTVSKVFRKNGAFTLDVAGPKYPRMESVTLSVAP